MICGHVHVFGYVAEGQDDGMLSYYLSGARGQTGGGFRGGDLSLKTNYGFLKVTLKGDKLYGKYYRADKRFSWRTWALPAWNLIEGREDDIEYPVFAGLHEEKK